MPAPRWFFRFRYDRESAAWERRRDEPEHRELVERAADELANVVAPPGPVVGPGCGPGAHALALARRGYDVAGVDRSPRMAALARTRAARGEVDATFDVHDVSAPLRFADASLAGVLAILVLQHSRSPRPSWSFTETGARLTCAAAGPEGAAISFASRKSKGLSPLVPPGKTPEVDQRGILAAS